MSPEFKYKTAFENSPDLAPHNSASLLLFALSIRYNIDDIPTLAADCLTEGGDDKKIDGIFIDEEELGLAVVVQAYKAQSEDKTAPSNKASDLNTAVTWLFNQPIESTPERLRPSIEALRSAIKNGKIQKLDFWYVHNCKESEAVSSELRAVERTAKSAINTNFPGVALEISALEVGQNILEDWYLGLSTPIIVNDEFIIDTTGGYTIDGKNWKSYVTAIPAKWLHEQFGQYGVDLFSANVRGYLGSRRSDLNINNGIKASCKDEPENFWVYNNGITCLVHSFKPESNAKLRITGVSILNGAQTTGAIGSSESERLTNAFVPARFVVCKDPTTLDKIIRYNNSQNKVAASDFRSNDDVQTRLRSEFESIPEADYKGRRGGAADIIKRSQNLIPTDTVAQSLAAFHGYPILAYNEKTDIWANNRHYAKLFNEFTTAKHIVFTCSLVRCIEKKKELLRGLGEQMTDSHKEQLSFLRERGSIILLASANAACMESFLGKSIPNKFRLSFGEISPSQAIGYWGSIVDITMPFCKYLNPALEGGLKNQEKVNAVTSQYKSFVEAIIGANKEVVDAFKSKVNEE